LKLSLAGICAKAFAKPLNKYNYQGDYSEEEGETGWNDFDLRSYDPQTGRWIQADPYDEFASPYVGMGGDPINKVDKDGGLSSGLTGAIIGGVIGATAAYFILKNNPDLSALKKVGIVVGGALLGAGFGYSIFESLASVKTGFNETNNFARNLGGFYRGFFGKGGTHLSNKDNFALWSPDIWGWTKGLYLHKVLPRWPLIGDGPRSKRKPIANTDLGLLWRLYVGTSPYYWLAYSFYNFVLRNVIVIPRWRKKE
jgi:RHS repeat-associated protein